MKKNIYILSLLVLFTAIISCKRDNQTGGNEELASLPRTNFNMGGVSFSLANIRDLDQVHRDSVGWGYLMPSTEENGPIVYYFTTNLQTLGAPHMRIEYIDKKIENMDNVESIQGWLKGLFLNDAQNGKVIGEDQTLTTMDGQEVKLLEIHRPGGILNDSVRRSDKFMAWCYIDQGDRFVAFNFSTTEEDKYNQGLPLFMNLIRSFKEE